MHVVPEIATGPCVGLWRPGAPAGQVRGRTPGLVGGSEARGNGAPRDDYPGDPDALRVAGIVPHQDPPDTGEPPPRLTTLRKFGRDALENELHDWWRTWSKRTHEDPGPGVALQAAVGYSHFAALVHAAVEAQPT